MKDAKTAEKMAEDGKRGLILDIYTSYRKKFKQLHILNEELFDAHSKFPIRQDTGILPVKA